MSTNEPLRARDRTRSLSAGEVGGIDRAPGRVLAGDLALVLVMAVVLAVGLGWLAANAPQSLAVTSEAAAELAVNAEQFYVGP